MHSPYLPCNGIAMDKIIVQFCSAIANLHAFGGLCLKFEGGGVACYLYVGGRGALLRG